MNKPSLIVFITLNSRTKANDKIERDARTINNQEKADPSAETRNTIVRWRDIFKAGIYRQPRGRWKTYPEPKFLINKRRIFEEQLQQAIRNLQRGENQQQAWGFQLRAIRQEQWKVDPFWEVDHQQRTAIERKPEQQGPSTPRIDRGTHLDGGGRDSVGYGPRPIGMPSKIPAVNWAAYVSVKSFQYIQMGHADDRSVERLGPWQRGGRD